MDEKLSKPRMVLIRALLREKYGERSHTALEMNTVIAENAMHRFKANGAERSTKVMQEAMSIAHKKLKGAISEEKKREKRYGTHIITSPNN